MYELINLVPVKGKNLVWQKKKKKMKGKSSEQELRKVTLRNVNRILDDNA